MGEGNVSGGAGVVARVVELQPLVVIAMKLHCSAVRMLVSVCTQLFCRRRRREHEHEHVMSCAQNQRQLAARGREAKLCPSLNHRASSTSRRQAHLMKMIERRTSGGCTFFTSQARPSRPNPSEFRGSRDVPPPSADPCNALLAYA